MATTADSPNIHRIPPEDPSSGDQVYANRQAAEYLKTVSYSRRNTHGQMGLRTLGRDDVDGRTGGVGVISMTSVRVLIGG